MNRRTKQDTISSWRTLRKLSGKTLENWISHLGAPPERVIPDATRKDQKKKRIAAEATGADLLGRQLFDKACVGRVCLRQEVQQLGHLALGRRREIFIADEGEKDRQHSKLSAEKGRREGIN